MLRDRCHPRGQKLGGTQRPYLQHRGDVLRVAGLAANGEARADAGGGPLACPTELLRWWLRIHSGGLQTPLAPMGAVLAPTAMGKEDRKIGVEGFVEGSPCGLGDFRDMACLMRDASGPMGPQRHWGTPQGLGVTSGPLGPPGTWHVLGEHPWSHRISRALENPKGLSLGDALAPGDTSRPWGPSGTRPVPGRHLCSIRHPRVCSR